jgi:hypothetical protein
VIQIAMAQCAGGMGGGILTLIKANELHDHKRTIFLYLWLSGGSAADVLIAVTMTALVRLAHPLPPQILTFPPQLFNASSIPATRDAVRGIVRLIIETNTLSAIVAITGLVLFIAVPVRRPTHSKLRAPN